MHEPEILEKNWEKLKHKRVIFRSIGQCMPHQENLLAKLKGEGLQIVRYSPKEAKIPNFAGESAMIRFYKDPEEYQGWTGEKNIAINITQSIKQRAEFCYYSEIDFALSVVPHKFYGTSNEDLGDEWGGLQTDAQLRDRLREARVYVYGGTYPAQYTLSFIEAMMTGIPIVTIGREISLAKWPRFDYLETYEIIKNGSNGFAGNTREELASAVRMLVANHSLAKEISANGRQTAIELFGKEKIKKEWQEFLG